VVSVIGYSLESTDRVKYEILVQIDDSSKLRTRNLLAKTIPDHDSILDSFSSIQEVAKNLFSITVSLDGSKNISSDLKIPLNCNSSDSSLETFLVDSDIKAVQVHEFSEQLNLDSSYLLDSGFFSTGYASSPKDPQIYYSTLAYVPIDGRIDLHIFYFLNDSLQESSEIHGLTEFGDLIYAFREEGKNDLASTSFIAALNRSILLEIIQQSDSSNSSNSSASCSNNVQTAVFVGGTPSSLLTIGKLEKYSSIVSQLRWATVEKEAFPIIHALDKLDYFLKREDGFELFTDHRNLTYILNPDRDLNKINSDRLHRWASQLMCFRFVIHHITGVTGELNYWPDLLSRWGSPSHTLKSMKLRIFFSANFDDLIWPTLEEILEQQHSGITIPENVIMDLESRIYFTDAKQIWIPNESLAQRIMIIAHSTFFRPEAMIPLKR
jgi:hypothetical protein